MRSVNLGAEELIRTECAARRDATRNSRRSRGFDWFNTRLLLAPIDYLPPAEYEARYY